MALVALDHVNLRTSRLEEMCAFYCDLLGLVRGPRPPFAFGGAWLYCAGRPCVHLVEVAGDTHIRAGEPSLSHFAFSATGKADLLERLRRAGVEYAVAALPGSNVEQVNMADPDGNHLHVDFAGEGERGAG
jgi:catechol 2,3-dioxygenase-like lactoylglutathione lyase family enzyme